MPPAKGGGMEVYMKIVILDAYTENPGDLSWEKIKSLGDVAIYDRTPCTDIDLIAERIGDAQIAIVNKTPVNAQVIDRCKNLKFIAVFGTGYNIVDYKYAAEKGIPLSNVPSYGTNTVSQFTIGLLLEVCSFYGHHDMTVKNRRWEKSEDFCYWDYPMIELYGKTAGIIGLGKIGRASAALLKALGMEVIAFSRSKNKEGEKAAVYVSFDELLERSDVILLHCPLFEETKGMINKKSIKKMKDGVIIINTSRGQLIVEEDLAEALNSGKVYAAGLDVVAQEPIRADNPLLKAKNVIITPHIAWVSKESRQRILDATYANIKAFLDGKPINVVNL